MIAAAFHRTGAVEVWGRGTNRVIAMCKKHGAAPPAFSEQSGFLTVTFKAQMVAETAVAESGAESGVESGVESPMTLRVLHILGQRALGKQELVGRLGKKCPWRYLNEMIARLVQEGVIEMTIPDKPNSRLQKYRLTQAGKRAIEKAGKG